MSEKWSAVLVMNWTFTGNHFPRTVGSMGTVDHVTTSTRADTRTTSPVRLWIRVALGYLIVVSSQIGVWALVAPRSFYDDFPGLGRTWVAVDGPYNEHLVRDVGALNLALTVLFAAAWWRLDRHMLTVAGGAALAWGVPHALYHVTNTDGLGGSDVAASLLGLVLFVIVGAGLLWSARHIDSDHIGRAS
jgi:hypothetical protein